MSESVYSVLLFVFLFKSFNFVNASVSFIYLQARSICPSLISYCLKRLRGIGQFLPTDLAARRMRQLVILANRLSSRQQPVEWLEPLCVLAHTHMELAGKAGRAVCVS